MRFLPQNLLSRRSRCRKLNTKIVSGNFYTVAGRAIDFALEQPLRVVAFACSASGILK
ncbi:MAG: hypothetical protein LBJ00_11515 [Planctomycetaceae bacterium]|nr:hypothetical protein [Planctomycetaceae bacterium]